MLAMKYGEAWGEDMSRDCLCAGYSNKPYVPFVLSSDSALEALRLSLQALRPFAYIVARDGQNVAIGRSIK